MMEIGRYGNNDRYIFKNVCLALTQDAQKSFDWWVCKILWSLGPVLTLLYPSLYFWGRKMLITFPRLFSQLAYQLVLVGGTNGRIKGRTKREAIYFPALGSSSINESSISGQQVPLWSLLSSQILIVAMNMSPGDIGSPSLLYMIFTVTYL